MALLCNSDRDPYAIQKMSGEPMIRSHVLAAARRAATSCANAGLDKIKDAG
jgi:hypothetical protein